MAFLIPIILLAGLGGGAYWYFTKGPGQVAAARQITLDTGLPDADKQTVIAAIMTAKDPTQTDALATQYSQYPWTAYELQYKSWQLRGSVGSPPAQPTTGGQPVPVPAAPAPAPSQMPPPGVVPSAGPAPAPGAPAASPIPAGYDMAAAAAVSGAWQNDSTFIQVYQQVLTFLSQQQSQPSWAPAAISGAFDASTQAAVKAFQTANGLSPVDGEVGPATATAMLNAIGAVTQASGMGYGVSPVDVARAAMSHTGSDMMWGYKPYTTERQEEVSGAPRMVKEEIEGFSRDRNQMTGQGDITGAEQVEHIAAAPLAAAAVAAAGQAAAGLAPVVDAGITPVTARPRGGWYVIIRPEDKIWPRSLVSIGTGVHRGAAGAMRHLVDLNPHLAPGGVIRQFVPGDEVNIPEDWATRLKAKGLRVDVDPAEQRATA